MATTVWASACSLACGPGATDPVEPPGTTDVATAVPAETRPPRARRPGDVPAAASARARRVVVRPPIGGGSAAATPAVGSGAGAGAEGCGLARRARPVPGHEPARRW